LKYGREGRVESRFFNVVNKSAPRGPAMAPNIPPEIIEQITRQHFVPWHG
jgi:hypothetical protein